MRCGDVPECSAAWGEEESCPNCVCVRHGVYLRIFWPQRVPAEDLEPFASFSAWFPFSPPSCSSYKDQRLCLNRVRGVLSDDLRDLRLENNWEKYHLDSRFFFVCLFFIVGYIKWLTESFSSGLKRLCLCVHHAIHIFLVYFVFVSLMWGGGCGD